MYELEEGDQRHAGQGMRWGACLSRIRMWWILPMLSIVEGGFIRNLHEDIMKTVCYPSVGSC